MYEDIVAFIKAYENVDYQTIKVNLRAKRKALGLTPKYFEAKVGIPATQYGQFEKLSYKFKPSLETLVKICHAMDVPILELLHDEQKPKPPKKVRKIKRVKS